MFNNQFTYLSLILFIYYWWTCDHRIVVEMIEKYQIQTLVPLENEWWHTEICFIINIPIGLPVTFIPNIAYGT